MLKIQNVEINTPFIKLDSLLKFAGISPDGVSAKQIILEGMVKVNGEQCLMRGKKVYPGDSVIVDGIKIMVKEQA